MRIFTAVALPDSLKDGVWESFRTVRESYTGIKWVERENLHLTVRFFGEVAENTVTLIRDATEQVAGSHEAFSASLGSAGTFPERGSPRVLWVGLDQGRETFLSLGAAVERSYRESDLGSSDKKLSPHVTVARVKQRGVPRRIVEEIRTLTFPGEEFRISSIRVYESVLRPQGPLYRVVADCALGMF